jgi:hypothetical protein
MNFSGATANTWLLALCYVCLLLKNLASAALGWISPDKVLTGQRPDISKFLHFLFYEPVYYHAYSDKFPSVSTEEQGWWVSVALHVGDALTYKILTKHNKVIYRSAIRFALDPAKRNQRLSPLGGERASTYLGGTMFVCSKLPSDLDPELIDNDPSVKRCMVTIDPKDLIGRTFLKDEEEDGQRFRARVVRAIIDKEDALKKGHEYMKFICEVPRSTVDEIFTYNEILDHIEKDNNDLENDTGKLFKYCRITAHQGPLRTSDKDYKGSTYNVLVKWESGETTCEPLYLIESDDPMTCADYAKENDLLETAGWKQFKRLAKSEKRLKQMINQAKLKAINQSKLKSYRRDPFWKLVCLFQKPRSSKGIRQSQWKHKVARCGRSRKGSAFGVQHFHQQGKRWS